jgi:hypothetical protein
VTIITGSPRKVNEVKELSTAAQRGQAALLPRFHGANESARIASGEDDLFSNRLKLRGHNDRRGRDWKRNDSDLSGEFYLV